MRGLSARTSELVQRLFPAQAEAAGKILVEQCGTNLPFLQDQNEQGLERVRFAALKISNGDLQRLQEAVEVAQRDWRDELIWAGFAEHVDAHARWAAEILGEK